MKKITFLIATMFAFVGSVFAQVPSQGDFGYLFNTYAGRFLSKTATLTEAGDEYGIVNQGNASEFEGYTYIRWGVNDESLDLGAVKGNYLKFYGDTGFNCNGTGYHKWAVFSTEKGLLIRCIYTDSQIKALNGKNPQGYYLAASVAADGAVSLVMVEAESDATYWKFVAGDDYTTAKASAEDLYNAALAIAIEEAGKEAEEQAKKDAEEAAANKELLKDMQVGDEILSILFPNAGFDVSNNADGWTVTMNGGNNPSFKVVNGNCGMTKYQGTIKLEKTIRGLTSGWYTLKAQAFGRKGTHATNRSIVEAGEEPETPGVIFANEETQQVPSVYDGLIDESDENVFVETSTEGQFDLQNPSVHYFGQVTIEGVNKYVLDNSNSGTYAFSIGKYETELNVFVDEDGVLTFGFDKNTADSGDYCGCDNFRLIYVGDDPTTGISSVAKKAPVKAIFNIAGQQIKSLQKGLNIVDGKKILVK